MPEIISSNSLRYWDRELVPYDVGSCGWLSRYLDPILSELCEKLSLPFRNVRKWVSGGKQSFVVGREGEKGELFEEMKKGGAEGGVGKGWGFQGWTWNPDDLNDFFFVCHVSPDVNGRLSKSEGSIGGEGVGGGLEVGAEGRFYEIVPVPAHRSFLVYALIERGRNIRRKLVFTSDFRWTLADFTPRTEKRMVPYAVGTGNAAGNFFGCLLDVQGGVIGRSEDRVGVDSVVLRRKVKEWVGEYVEGGEEEEYLGPDCLVGLLPESLLEAFSFWKVTERVVVGYHKGEEGGEEGEGGGGGGGKAVLEWWGRRCFLLIELLEDEGRKRGRRWRAVVKRVPLPRSALEEVKGEGDEGESEEDEESSSSSLKVMVLLDVLNVENNSALGKISARMAQLDNCSHILV